VLARRASTSRSDHRQAITGRFQRSAGAIARQVRDRSAELDAPDIVATTSTTFPGPASLDRDLYGEDTQRARANAKRYSWPEGVVHRAQIAPETKSTPTTLHRPLALALIEA